MYIVQFYFMEKAKRYSDLEPIFLQLVLYLKDVLGLTYRQKILMSIVIIFFTMYTYNCHFLFLRAYLFVFAPLSEASNGVGTIRPSGSRCRRFGRDPCRVSCVASLSNSFGLGHT